MKKPAKERGCDSTGLDATPTVQIHICHPVNDKRNKQTENIARDSDEKKNEGTKLK